MLSDLAQRYAREIAADIRKNGHWQGGTSALGHYSNFRSDLPVCPIYSPTYERNFHMISTTSDERVAFQELMDYLIRDTGYSGIGAWNDTESTETVLAKLDRAGEGG